MVTQSDEVTKILEFVKENRDVTAIVAPAFAAEYTPEELFTILNHIGFTRAVEVSQGAVIVNQELEKMITDNPSSRFITSPCPSMMRFIKTKYPELMSYLSPLDSPMSATAKLVRERYPDTRIVFVGPCLMKKLEAKEQFPELNITVITFQELEAIRSLVEQKDGIIIDFETFGKDVSKTRMYPVSGGLSQSSRVRELLGDGVRVVDGPKNVGAALEVFKIDFSVKLLDILMCEGGCIGGKGFVTNTPLEERKKRVQVYMER